MSAVYELLRTDTVGGTGQVFTKFHEKDITRIRDLMCMEKRENWQRAS